MGHTAKTKMYVVTYWSDPHAQQLGGGKADASRVALCKFRAINAELCALCLFYQALQLWTLTAFCATQMAKLC